MNIQKRLLNGNDIVDTKQFITERYFQLRIQFNSAVHLYNDLEHVIIVSDDIEQRLIHHLIGSGVSFYEDQNGDRMNVHIGSAIIGPKLFAIANCIEKGFKLLIFKLNQLENGKIKRFQLTKWTSHVNKMRDMENYGHNLKKLYKEFDNNVKNVFESEWKKAPKLYDPLVSHDYASENILDYFNYFEKCGGQTAIRYQGDVLSEDVYFRDYINNEDAVENTDYRLTNFDLLFSVGETVLKLLSKDIVVPPQSVPPCFEYIIGTSIKERISNRSIGENLDCARIKFN